MSSVSTNNDRAVAVMLGMPWYVVRAVLPPLANRRLHCAAPRSIHRSLHALCAAARLGCADKLYPRRELPARRPKPAARPSMTGQVCRLPEADLYRRHE